MITRLAENLYHVISDLNIMIERGFYTDLKQHYRALEASINEFKETPEILYKEHFEPWCKVDFCRFCQLFNIIQKKEDYWQIKTLLLIPDFYILFNSLCEIYDEIEMRRPDIIKDIETDGLNEQTDTAKGLRLSDELNTDRARKYFARAVEAKFMELTPTGAKWLKPLARLGYLCLKIYPQPRPITALEKYFNVRKLSSNITNASIDAHRADVIKWRAEIDKLFID